MQPISTVCMLLGPYRNLTTLTASSLALHPNISVLNHGGERVFSNPDLDFTQKFSPDTFARFCDFARQASKGGKKGGYGGSITLSGSFNSNRRLKERYKALYPNGKPEQVDCLFWKEPHRLLYQLQKHDFDFAKAFALNEQIRFLIPVRNIFDCACSNYVSGHYTIAYSGLRRDPDLIEGTRDSRRAALDQKETWPVLSGIIDRLLSDLRYLNELRIRFPDRFMFFFQYEDAKNIIERTLEFLKVGPDQNSIHKFFKVRTTEYTLRSEHRNEILMLIEKHFSDHPKMAESLKRLF